MSKQESMSARERLAADISAVTDHWNFPIIGSDAEKIAVELEEKGYSKPRMITTVAELDDLPQGSVVLDPLEAVAICIGRGLWTMGGDEYTGRRTRRRLVDIPGNGPARTGARQVIPDAAVEAAARSMAPAVWGPSVWQFAAHGEAPADARDRVQQQALKDARKALEAAAPHMLSHERGNQARTP